MIKITASLPIISISPVMQVSDRFSKRELILDDGWEKDGQRYESPICVEFTGEQLMQQLDQYGPGMIATVEGYISGREYNGRYYTSIRGRSISPYQAPQSQAYQQPYQQGCQQAPQPGYAPQPAQSAYQPTAPQQYQQPQYQQPQYQQPYQQPMTQRPQQPGTPGIADLPFPT